MTTHPPIPEHILRSPAWARLKASAMSLPSDRPRTPAQLMEGAAIWLDLLDSLYPGVFTQGSTPLLQNLLRHCLVPQPCRWCEGTGVKPYTVAVPCEQDRITCFGGTQYVVRVP